MYYERLYSQCWVMVGIFSLRMYFSFQSSVLPLPIFSSLCLFLLHGFSVTTPVKLQETANTPSSLTSQTSKSGSLVSVSQPSSIVFERNLSLLICYCVSMSTLGYKSVYVRPHVISIPSAPTKQARNNIHVGLQANILPSKINQ